MRRTWPQRHSMRSLLLGLLLVLAPPTGWALAASSSSVLGMYRSQDRPGTVSSNLQQQGSPATTGLGNPDDPTVEDPNHDPTPGADPTAGVLQPAPVSPIDEPQEEPEVTQPDQTPEPQPQDPPTEPEMPAGDGEATEAKRIDTSDTKDPMAPPVIGGDEGEEEEPTPIG